MVTEQTAVKTCCHLSAFCYHFFTRDYQSCSQHQWNRSYDCTYPQKFSQVPLKPFFLSN